MAQSASLLASFQTIVGRVDALLARRRTGQGQHRQAAQGRRVVRPPERHRRGDAEPAGRRARRPRAPSANCSTRIRCTRNCGSPLQRRRTPSWPICRPARESAGKILKDPALFDEAKQSLAEIHQLLADVGAGKGTAGKLLKDEGTVPAVWTSSCQVQHHIDKINAGQGTIGPVPGEPAALRIAQRRHQRDPVAGQGHPGRTPRNS